MKILKVLTSFNWCV